MVLALDLVTMGCVLVVGMTTGGTISGDYDAIDKDSVMMGAVEGGMVCGISTVGVELVGDIYAIGEDNCDTGAKVMDYVSSGSEGCGNCGAMTGAVCCGI